MNEQTALTQIVTSTPADLLVYGWLDAKFHKSRSEKTRKAYQDTLLQFRSALQQTGLDLDMQEDQALTAIALLAQKFASWSARGRQVKEATINQRLAILSSFYEYAMRQRPELYRVNPITRIERSKVQAYAGAQPLSNEQTAAALAAIDRASLAGKRDYAILALLLQTGRRLAEVEGLEVRDLAELAGKVTVTFRHCKGGKVMYDTLPYSVTNALLDWLRAFYGSDLVTGRQDDTRPVWVSLVSTRRGQALGSQSFADICQKHLKVSKVHATRHTWSHRMDELGASAATIQARLGHESLATTGRYLARLKSADNPLADKLAADLGIE